MNIRDELFSLQDSAYGDFQARLIPGISRESIIGVRVPEARRLAKKLMQSSEACNFLNELPHKYYDENMLHGLLVSEIKDYDECIAAVDKFLPYVDNWAVCDTMSPKIFIKHKAALLDKIGEWSSSKMTYTCRFGIEMLMSYFLDDDFKVEYLNIPASVHSEEYYVQMMIAWYFAEALAKQWHSSVKYLEDNRLDIWVHNKTIQKARESRRLTSGQKDYLLSLKR